MPVHVEDLTLFDELSDMTISEWTLGVLRAPLTEFVTALKMAERRWSLEKI